MLQISNLYKAYGRQALLEDVTLTVNPGERVGLVGRNGHGKTTLFRMILGEEYPDSGVISVPSGYSIGHLRQHLDFTEDTVLKEACLALSAADDGSDETYKAKNILMGLGFEEQDFARNPLTLSGGYQIRLNLAKVLIQCPNLLLLDEPTNYLDILSVRWLTGFLRGWRNELILITHDRDFMDSVTTHTMGIHRLKIRKTAGPTLKLYDQLLMEEEVYEKTRQNDERKRAEMEQFINRFRAKATKAKAVQSRIKTLQKKGRMEKLAEIRDLEFQFRTAPFTGKYLLELDSVDFSFSAHTPPLIKGLSISVGGQDRIGVIGRNGKGKTTLLNLLAGELSPLHGSIKYSPKAKPAYFGQTNINRLDPAKTVEEEVLSVMPEHSRTAARNICGIMMFEGDNALKKVSVLSGGERSRVLLGKLLVTPSNLLLLDEPTNHLDMESIDSLVEALEVFEGAVIIVTHSELILNAVADRLIVFDEGKVRVFEGGYKDFLERSGWAEESEAGKKEAQDKAERERAGSKKDQRRLRAEIIAERSRTLGPLQARATEIEQAIMDIEASVEQDTASLVSASGTGDWQTSAALSKAVQASKEEIERLFDELAVISESIEAGSRKFNERLNALS